MESRLVAVPEPDILHRDEEAAVDHARRFLNALGVRCDTPDTLNTPKRMAEAFARSLVQCVDRPAIGDAFQFVLTALGEPELAPND